MRPFLCMPITILVLVIGLFEILMAQNSPYAECRFRRDDANLVIKSTYVLDINWAKLATKWGPISSLSESMKRLKKG